MSPIPMRNGDVVLLRDGAIHTVCVRLSTTEWLSTKSTWNPHERPSHEGDDSQFRDWLSDPDDFSWNLIRDGIVLPCEMEED